MASFDFRFSNNIAKQISILAVLGDELHMR